MPGAGVKSAGGAITARSSFLLVFAISMDLGGGGEDPLLACVLKEMRSSGPVDLGDSLLFFVAIANEASPSVICHLIELFGSSG